MKRETIVELLADHPTFEICESEELERLVAACTPRTFHVGEALWSSGEPGAEAFVLLSGRVERTTRVHPDGHRTQQYSAPGDLMSLSMLVQRSPHTSSGTALERTEVLEMPRATFRSFFDEEHPATFAMVDRLAEELVAEMRDANRRLHEVFGHPADTLRTLRRRLRASDS